MSIGGLPGDVKQGQERFCGSALILTTTYCGGELAGLSEGIVLTPTTESPISSNADTGLQIVGSSYRYDRTANLIFNTFIIDVAPLVLSSTRFWMFRKIIFCIGYAT